jgi:hypothetical protein
LARVVGIWNCELNSPTIDADFVVRVDDLFEIGEIVRLLAEWSWSWLYFGVTPLTP